MCGNWVVTKTLIEYTIERGLVERTGDKAYRITDEGVRLIPDLRRAVERLSPESLAQFPER
jgi:predicted transcriptional regulator